MTALEPIGIEESLAHIRATLAPIPRGLLDVRNGYLVACGNSPSLALSVCLGCSQDHARSIMQLMSFQEYCNVLQALNDGNESEVERIVGLRGVA